MSTPHQNQIDLETELAEERHLKRYFYTDPLAAAWMAKHFQMKFESSHAREIQFSMEDEAAVPKFELITPTPDKYGWVPTACCYINRDSIPLLEPQVGDLIHDTKGRAFAILPKVNATRLTYYQKSLMPRSWIKVIQRNGIPFMWPESEDA